MAEVKKKKWRWYAKITSREDALDAVKGSSTAFFVVGAIQVAVSFFLGFSILFDAAIYLIGGFLLHRFHSRAAAVVILVLAAFSLYVTVANRLGENLGGGSNIFLSLIVFWAAIRAVEATFKLRSRFALEALPVEPSKT